MRILLPTLSLMVLAACAQEAPTAAPTSEPPATTGMPDAAVTAAPDAGHAPPDSGHVVADAGRPLPDAGARTHDAGTPDSATSTPDAGMTATPDAGAQGTDAGLLGQRCFSEIFDPNRPGPDYDQFSPVVGSHCKGTNHQDITGVERVVFLGDSVTVGTPPTVSGDFYRSRLSDMLAQRFNLDAPDYLWRTANVFNGTAGAQESGDFASCAKWGARADDFLRDNAQIETCIPEGQRNKRTLVVFTIGGNDIAALQKDGVHAPYAQSRAQVEEFVSLLRGAVEWLKAPGRFPNGVFVVFGNMYEFTDGTGDVGSCPAASVGGFSEPWDDPAALEELVIWANEQFMAIAKDTGSDMTFMLESFCGHGFKNDDPTNRCYRGPNTPRWFDLSCIHPNPEGHAQIADMFMSVVNE